MILQVRRNRNVFLRFWLGVSGEMTCDIWSRIGGELKTFWWMLGVWKTERNLKLLPQATKKVVVIAVAGLIIIKNIHESLILEWYMNKISHVSMFNRIFMSRTANISSLLICLEVLDFEDFVLTSFCHLSLWVLTCWRQVNTRPMCTSQQLYEYESYELVMSGNRGHASLKWHQNRGLSLNTHCPCFPDVSYFPVTDRFFL